MKNLKAPFLVIALLLFNLSFAGSDGPPVPYQATADDGSTTEDDDGGGIGDPYPPDYPINENIVFLLVGGIALGTSVIYKNRIKKASI